MAVASSVERGDISEDVAQSHLALVSFRFREFAALRTDVSARDEAVRAALGVASDQHCAVSVVQLRDRGVGARAQRDTVASGQLRIADPNVLVVTGSPDTWYRRLQVGLLGLGPDAWVSHEAAATLHGFDRCETAPVEFTVPRRRRSQAAQRRHRSHHDDARPHRCDHGRRIHLRERDSHDPRPRGHRRIRDSPCCRNRQCDQDEPDGLPRDRGTTFASARSPVVPACVGSTSC